MTNVVEVENLRVRFRYMGPVRAALRGNKDPYLDGVADVSFALAEGETLGLVGESGSGKSTLGRAIIGLTHYQEGRVQFEGQDVAALDRKGLVGLRQRMSMMFQDPVASLSPRKTVRYAITESLRTHGNGKPGKLDLDQEARRLMKLVGLPEHFLGAYPHQLSGGQARRVGVARALALNPALVLADEPTAGLDVSVQGEVLNLLAELKAELGLSLLIITHNLPIVRHISDRLAIMYLGRFVEMGPTEQVFQRPAHPYTLGLISAIPLPDPARKRPELELRGEVPSILNRPQGCEFHGRCPFAQEKCRTSAPEMSEIEPGWQVRCHFPFPDPTG